MEKIIAILNNKFDNKFDNLKLLDIVFNKSTNVCTISFLYPETYETLTTESKQEIANFLSDYLKLNAKVAVKFKKSYLDEEFILSSVENYFKRFQQSLASVINFKNIMVSKDVFNITLTIIIPEEILKTVNQENIKTSLITELKKEYIAEFDCVFVSGENIKEEKIRKNINDSLIERSKKQEITPRYKVFGAEKLIGKQITPEPEFLANIKDSKSSVILAGRIENFTKKSYIRKKKDKQIEKFYYKFTLKEDFRYLNMIYFCPQSHISKMDKLADGTEILVIADIKKENKYLNGYVRDISLCEINEEVRKSYKTKITAYSKVFPKRYIKPTQKTIFDKPIKYTANITNNSFVVFDVETTGLDANSCEIIEIGAVKVVGGEIIEKFQTLIKPTETISDFITNLTGITNEMVENAPSTEVAIKDFYLFTKGCVLSGYNVGFDMKFIQNAGKKFGISFLNEVQDVLELAREKLVLSNYKLSTVVKHLELELTNAHRALFDAIATAEVLLKLSVIEE